MKILVVYHSYEGSTKLIAGTSPNEMDIIPEREMASKGTMKFIWGESQAMIGRYPI